MFIVHVLISPEETVLHPSEQVFIDNFNKLMNEWDEIITGITTFLPDPFFIPFTV